MSDPNVNTASGAIAAAEAANVENILAELDLEDVVAGEPATDTVIEVDAEAENAVIEQMQAQEAAYESQEVNAAPVATEPTAAPAKPAKEKKAGTPRVARDITALPAETFVLTGETPADLEANKAEVLSKRPTQKKIAEKFDNLFGALAAGKKPSVYVMECFKALDAKKTVTSTELKAVLKAMDYSDGTANSQAGQIMVLFDVAGIAARTKSSLTLNADSAIAAKLRALV